ncbi:MAG: undecaprenyldiphospho-muramoylpentapeptide beta-N-acetylglucosaminyltransferase [Vicinamibacterales bacterium]
MPLTVVIAGGGTGGHLYPGIAVAREVLARDPGARVSFAGTSRGLEARVVPQEGFELDVIRSAGLKGKSIVARLRGVAMLVPGLIDAWRLLARRAPDVVIGVGGYSSGPVVLLAALRRVPTLVLEQNAAPGLTNRLLARVVRAAAVSWPDTLPYFRGKGFVAGNPVRREFFEAGERPAGTPAAGEAGAPVTRAGGAPRVLVIGGSQGAHVINVAMAGAAGTLARRVPAPVVVHQAGARDLDLVQDAYAAAALPSRVAPFLDPVAPEMAAADLVVCRAGATTLAELAAAGRPAVLVPYAAATDDHQRRNARVLVDGGAAEMVEERELDAATLAARIDALLADPARRTAMGAAMRTFARPDAAARIVDRVMALAGRVGA